MLIAYDAAGNVVGTLDWLVDIGPDGAARGLVDFAAHEAAGLENVSLWTIEGAAGSKYWPERLGSKAHGYRVELSGPPGQKRITALVDKESGERRGRSEEAR